VGNTHVAVYERVFSVSAVRANEISSTGSGTGGDFLPHAAAHALVLSKTNTASVEVNLNNFIISPFKVSYINIGRGP
jgi:hypothetical protein